MKELSTEEKARRYDEALERAKGAHNSAKSDKENGVTDKNTEYTILLAETIFPELKESEDEEMRKTLIKFFEEWHKTRSHCWGISLPKILAWLEKQGEQIDIANKEYWRGYREGKKEILDKYAELEKQGKQNTIWKPTEEQIKALEHLLETIRRHEYSYFHEEKFLLLHSLLEQLKKL